MKTLRQRGASRIKTGRSRISVVFIAALASTWIVLLVLPEVPAPDASATGARTLNLSTIVLSRTLYGLVQTPHGPENGSLTLSEIKRLPVYFPGERTLEGEMADGMAVGYVRTWINKPADGDLALIIALKFKKSTQANAFLSVDQSTLRSDELNEFLVPGVSGAGGFEILATQSPLGRTEYIADFARASIFFDVAVVNGLGDISTADAATLAKEQYARSPSG